MCESDILRVDCGKNEGHYFFMPCIGNDIRQQHLGDNISSPFVSRILNNLEMRKGKWQILPRIVLLLQAVLLLACDSRDAQQQLLVNKSCGSCHLVPDPGLLDKMTWGGVLPQMAFRMGLRNVEFKVPVPPGDSAAVYGSLPDSPMITDDEYAEIREYYLSHAPDSLTRIRTAMNTTLQLFDVSELRYPEAAVPFVTVIRADTTTHRTFLGTRSARIFVYGEDFTLEDSLQFDSPPSSIHFDDQNNLNVSLLGMLEPNESAGGALASITPDKKKKSFIDSLKRPVYYEKADLNNDHLDDYVVCEFGNYTGGLVAYENKGAQKFKRHVLYGLPGARKVVIQDFNHDGKPDIMVLMAQGNEQITMLTNQGDFHFTLNPLLRFPAVYGSSFFDLADFNNDGYFDILVANGDNGDFSNILKPYHGVRIFTNDGQNAFTESWFHPMYGASKAVARDFDLDGDLDIAAISFFPDFEKHPEQGFMYFENTGTAFVPHTIGQASSGRWLVMDAADVDHDGDCDLILGAFDLEILVPSGLLDRWHTQPVGALILRNTTRH